MRVLVSLCKSTVYLLPGEGRGFEISQGRLGPGRLHHCMRAVGMAELALELLCQRAASRSTFGKKLYQHVCRPLTLSNCCHLVDRCKIAPLCLQEVVAHWVAECRLMIEQTRLLTLHAAHALDTMGSRAARKQVKNSHRKPRLIEQYVIFPSFCHF